jgi:ABC-2 type transport system permease protein
MTEWLLFRNALRDQFKPARLAGTVLLVALPAALALLWRLMARSRFEPEVAYNTLAALLVFGFALVMLAVIFATNTISQDLEDKTIVYLLTRPVPRWRILLAKFAGSLLVVVLACWLAALALALVAYGPARLAESRLYRDLAIIPIGALAYGGLFLFLSTFTRRPLIYGLIFAFGWESWVPNMPGNFGKISLMSYLRVLAPHPRQQATDAGANNLLSVLTPQSIPVWLAWLVLGCVIFATLAGSLVVFSEREYAPREDAE